MFEYDLSLRLKQPGQEPKSAQNQSNEAEQRTCAVERGNGFSGIGSASAKLSQGNFCGFGVERWTGRGIVGDKLGELRIGTRANVLETGFNIVR